VALNTALAPRDGGPDTLFIVGLSAFTLVAEAAAAAAVAAAVAAAAAAVVAGGTSAEGVVSLLRIR